MSLEKLVAEKKWKTMSLNKKLMSIWAYVILRVSYRFDDGEAWQYPTTTYYRRFGDCEDTTVLFVILCRLANVPADSVFNACGYYYSSTGKFGHSYPIAKMEDGKWYVFETTLTSVPTHPKSFKDNETYGAEWGVANWLYQGKIIESTGGWIYSTGTYSDTTTSNKWSTT